MSISNTTKPPSSIFSLTFMLKSRRASPSRARMKMWPPSSTGIGIRLSSPRFRLIMAIRLKSEIHPACAAAPERSAIATGPINCLTDVSRVNNPYEGLDDQPCPFQVLRDTELDGLEEPGI